MVAYYLYTALGNGKPYYGFTHDPYLDLTLLSPEGCDRLFVAAVPLPVDLAAPIATGLQAGDTQTPGKPTGASPFGWIRALARRFGFRQWLSLETSSFVEMEDWLQHVRRQLRRRGFRYWRNVEVRMIEPHQAPRRYISPDFLGTVEELLWGRVLSYDELQSLVTRRNIASPDPLRDVLQALFLEDRLEIWPGIVSPLPGYSVCSRCGEKLKLETVDCPLCGRADCIVCPSCRSLGEVRSCRELYHGPIGERGKRGQVFPDLEPKFAFQLTPAQKSAALVLKSHVEQWIEHYEPATALGGSGDLPNPACLIWAVCGAGKTEIAFEALALALRIGLRVAFAIPRRDVVVELARRAETAFPKIPVTVLYGGATPPETMGPLVLATTHQLLRFAQCFDLAILDEADAFPYAGSAMLHSGFQRAVKPGGLRIYMTATPEPTMLKAAQRGTIHLITVPVRHHGYPVPVPEVILDRRHLLPSCSGKRDVSEGKTTFTLPKGFWVKLYDSLLEGNRVFIFVPRVWLVSVVEKAVSDQLKGGEVKEGDGLSRVAVLGIHSRDPKRDEKRLTFERKTQAVVVTTSVLERGITVPRADVIVLYAHDPLYDARTLMQMAGRSGRAASYPQGKVYFIAGATTQAIQWTIENLEEINAVAKQQGLLVVN